RSDTGLFNLTVVAGAGAEQVAPGSVDPELLERVALPHDDWPYLYLKQPTIPAHYLTALAGVIVIAAALIGLAMRGLPAAAAGPGALRADAALFGMGIGFLLLESKSVTEMSLLFGSTWSVNLLVFASILIVIAASNAIVSRVPRGSLSALFLGL